MKTNEIRKAFLDYFDKAEHTVVPSSSLVPAGDPTLLFVNAGMVQFKDCFLGAEKRPYTRATTCQKSLRISGKHNDLENVGRTARHHTFFEMLGNFSFGDYFKRSAIRLAWTFLTVELKLPKERLWVTVFQDDDEAEELWKSETDLFEGRVLRYGEKDNFWAMGDTGPCGPCSEIFYYLGDDVENQSEEEFRSTDTEYIEVWNLVFMQYNRAPDGTLSPLPKPSVDTGMGLERIAAVKQGVLSNYDTDLLRRIISFTEKLSGTTYDGSDYTQRDTKSDKQYAIDVALRVVADHVRASSFLIAEGILPSSDGRGYVLRRLIRRACRHGRELGLKEPFMFKVSQELAATMGEAYPELVQKKETISKVLRGEEEKFLQTLETGLGILTKGLDETRARNKRVLPGVVAFSLHDTYGFPLDLTEDIARAEGLSVDRDEFSRAMEEQRERSRNARASQTELILQKSVEPLPTEFVGYDYEEYESSILGLFDESGRRQSATAGDEIAVVTAETPFYAESGGQIGDTGGISAPNAALEVIDTQKVAGGTFAHICRVLEGEVSTGDNVRLQIESSRRQRLRVHHSATHLLHLALREVLGEHVKQAGSRVSDQSLRFDFNHFQPVTPEELRSIEEIVNREIQNNHEVITKVLPIEEAQGTGAMQLFGEKYGDTVRVVEIGPRSLEFCGGTHSVRGGDIGSFSVVSEGSISSGVRRIEALAGMQATKRIATRGQTLKAIIEMLNSNEQDVAERLQRVLESQKKLEKEQQRLEQKVTSQSGNKIADMVAELSDGRKYVAELVELANPKQLREMADSLKDKMGSGCVALGSVMDGKVILLTAVTDDLVGKYHAGNIVKELSKIVGGSGGGRADMAQAGGGDPGKVNEALVRFRELIE